MRGEQCAMEEAVAPNSASWRNFVTLGLTKDLCLRISSQAERIGGK